jgi:acyl dehydratase
LRFIKPVFIGDTISARVTIAEKREHKRPDHGMVVERLEVLNQQGETVLACDHLLLVRRSNGGTEQETRMAGAAGREQTPG